MQSPQKLSRNATISRSAEQISAEVAGEVLVMDLESGEYFSLRGVAVRAWELLERPHTVAELESRILEQYDAPPDVVRRDLETLLGALMERGLITASSKIE